MIKGLIVHERTLLGAPDAYGLHAIAAQCTAQQVETEAPDASRHRKTPRPPARSSPVMARSTSRPVWPPAPAHPRRKAADHPMPPDLGKFPK